MEPKFTWIQPKFGLHGKSLENRNFSNFQNFNDTNVEVIGSLKLQNVEVSGDATTKKKRAEGTAREEDDYGKKLYKKCMPSLKLKGTLQKKVINDETELEDLDDEEEPLLNDEIMRLKSS